MFDVVGFNRSVSTHINSHTCNPNPFLHDLQPDDELYAAAGVQLSTSDSEKHREIGVRACRLTLVNYNVLDVLELCFGPDSIISFATSQAAEDVSGFLVSSSFCQPTRTLWEEPADTEQHQKWYDLEGDWESPTDF